MSLYSESYKEIENRKVKELHPKPLIVDALLSEMCAIAQIKDTGNGNNRAGILLIFFIYNNYQAQQSAAVVKAKFPERKLF